MTDVWVWKERTKRTAFRKDCPDTTSITWALMQLHIRQHLHIMLATVRLFVKYCLLINNKCGWSGAAFLASFTLIQRFPRSVTEICVSNVCVCVCFSATLLAFLVELLKSSVAMQEQMLGGKGFLVIGYLLEKVSKRPPRQTCSWMNNESSLHDSSNETGEISRVTSQTWLSVWMNNFHLHLQQLLTCTWDYAMQTITQQVICRSL